MDYITYKRYKGSGIGGYFNLRHGTKVTENGGFLHAPDGRGICAVTSEDGLKHLRRHLSPLKKLKGIDFTVVNGENISGTGLTPQQADDLFAAGADVITLGNHEFDYGFPS